MKMQGVEALCRSENFNWGQTVWSDSKKAEGDFVLFYATGGLRYWKNQTIYTRLECSYPEVTDEQKAVFPQSSGKRRRWSLDMG